MFNFIVKPHLFEDAPEELSGTIHIPICRMTDHPMLPNVAGPIHVAVQHPEAVDVRDVSSILALSLGYLAFEEGVRTPEGLEEFLTEIAGDILAGIQYRLAREGNQ